MRLCLLNIRNNNFQIINCPWAIVYKYLISKLLRSIENNFLHVRIRASIAFVLYFLYLVWCIYACYYVSEIVVYYLHRVMGSFLCPCFRPFFTVREKGTESTCLSHQSMPFMSYRYILFLG